jgi:hypothetical protein
MATKKEKHPLDPSNPIVIAVAPMKAIAMDRNEAMFRDMVVSIHAKLESLDWSLRDYAPYPCSRTMRTIEYQMAARKRAIAESITKPIDGKEFYRWNASVYMLSSKSSAGLFAEFKQFLKYQDFAIKERLNRKV